ncbi:MULTISPECIES: 4-hydroxy-tetrahydrodipicolinate reductase [Staphylococcus]|uniref:4-hydroxy-tetrahydrodipicolinate reductase n=1 Tax=Staphylococcus TaxID=1279 RepID=UPI00069F0A1E|nr:MULTISPECIES: 4-hydroxy-tetrahydrodipicolinate reductase [Staphylococcus]MBY6178965.1 4-hydroxy-tetrahydrodipicolinate reductase [Staphylococcaceae bacterium DP2N0-1]MCH4389638.1 4-hydroxy-tetrahydrodipicolinate reductase [Staphylococcus haemolyticus]MCH4403925.1 4-hydroxy-tetrahydrodipicolinate reductase [Staphylococcus haemolyticus]MCH4518760.1 4-hydroxy-tetrahydrodipicolinate reductase [Staphylococcus haemolyticus]MCH4535292.1 4-hydroxy-tetrahydrodipicolinate reductase [Staphylococcus ha
MKILLIGYGAMNQRVARLAEEKGYEIIGVIEPQKNETTPYTHYDHIADAQNEADVAIDFSNPNLLLPLLEEEFQLPLVIATTGEKEKLVEKLNELSHNMPIFFSANMSYGVHALTKILEAAVPLLQDYDIELTEAHHNKKVDAPSGTLVKIYDVIKDLRQNITPVYDRHEHTEQRTKDEVGIHSIRGGTIVGEHDVLFAGTDETITISHKAQSKDIFANGAITAAEKLINQSSGYYTFDNL